MRKMGCSRIHLDLLPESRAIVFEERAYALRLAGGASLTERAEAVYVHCIFGGPTVSAFALALLAPLNRPIEKYFYIGIRYIEI